MKRKLVALLPNLSRGAFFVTVVLIPFRLRYVLLSRPVLPLWADYTDILLYASDVTLLLTLAFWFLHHYLKPAPIQTGPAFLTVPMVGLALVALGTSISSIDPVFSFYQSVRLVMLIGLYLYVLNHVKSLRQLIAPLSVMAGIQATVAIIQSLTQHSIGLQWLGEYELDPAWSGVSIVWANSVRSLRSYGLAAHPNILGGVLTFSGLLLLAWHLNAKTSIEVIPFATLAIAVIATFLTFSRSSWLGSAVGVGFIAYQGYIRANKSPSLKDIALLGALLLLLIPFVWTNKELVGLRLGERIAFQEIEPELGSMGERRVLISAANTVFEENAILGIGIGAAPRAFMQAFPSFPVNYAPPHNVILNAALETGLVGGLLYLILLIAPWVALYLNRKGGFSNELLASSAVLLAIAAVGFFDCYPWCSWTGQLWQYLTWGVWAGAFVQLKARQNT